MSDGSGARLSVRRLTTATGYVSLGLLVITLVLGPINLLRQRGKPVSNYLRRDVGIWTAIFGLAHVVISFQVHRAGDVLGYFVEDGRLLLDSFGLANYTGLAATAILAGLAALSNDAVLRRLKAKPWKRLQRLNYALFALVVAHALLYGALGRPTSPFTLLLGVSVAIVFAGQAAGVWLWRRRSDRRLAVGVARPAPSAT